MPNYRVHFIESLDPAQLLRGQEQRTAMSAVLRQLGVPCATYLVVNKEQLLNALAIVTAPDQKKHIPLVHFLAHGSADGGGIALTDGTAASWPELKGWLQDMNEAMGGGLVLCMSSCRGFNAYRMAKPEGADQRSAFHTLVGSAEDVGFADTLVAFTSFYQLVTRKSVPPKDAAFRMNGAAGLHEGTFVGVDHDRAKEQFSDLYVRGVDEILKLAEKFEWLATHLPKA